MYENNTSSAMRVMLRAGVSCSPVWFDHVGRGNPGLKQPAAV